MKPLLGAEGMSGLSLKSALGLTALRVQVCVCVFGAGMHVCVQAHSVPVLHYFLLAYTATPAVRVEEGRPQSE